MDLVLLTAIALGCIAVGIAEAVCAATWAPFYFRQGPALYQRIYRIPPDFPPEIDIARLEMGFRGSLFPGLVFKKIGERDYAFRETILQPCLFRYVPMMKGQIRIEPQAGMMTVKGRLGWFSMVCPLCIAGTVIFAGESLSFSAGTIIILVFAMTLLYFIQARRFDGVGALLTDRK